MLVKLNDVVDRVTGNEDRLVTKMPYYLGGEHYESESIGIYNKGLIKSAAGAKLGFKFHFPFKKGDTIFMSRNAHLKKAGMVMYDGICSDTSYILRTKDENKLLPEFLPLVIQNDRFWNFFEENKSGSVNFLLNWKEMREYEFDLPSIDHQHKIVEMAWSMEHTKRAYLRLLAYTNLLVRSKFEKEFLDSSREVSLQDYVWYQEGPGVRSKDFTDDGVVLLTGSNINNNEITFGYSSDRFISRELADGKYNHFLCDKDDILVVTSAIAPEKFDEKVVVVDTDREYCLNTGIIRFKPDLSYMTRAYFIEFLKSNYFKRQVSVNMAGICQMHFGPSHLKKMTLLLPDSFDRQHDFEIFVKQSEDSKAGLNKALADLSTAFKKIISENVN